MGYPLFCIRKECMDTNPRIDLKTKLCKIILHNKIYINNYNLYT